MSVLESFATRLKKLREIAGLTQAQLADKLKVSRGSISYYENSDRVPDIEFLDKVSELFDVPYAYLLGRSNNMIEKNVNIGSVTGLSDLAIGRLWELDESAEILNTLLENEKFLSILRDICDYIRGDNILPDWASFDDKYASFLLVNDLIDFLFALRVQHGFRNLTREEILEEMKSSQQRYEQRMEKSRQEERDWLEKLGMAECLNDLKDDKEWREQDEIWRKIEDASTNADET